MEAKKDAENSHQTRYNQDDRISGGSGDDDKNEKGHTVGYDNSRECGATCLLCDCRKKIEAAQLCVLYQILLRDGDASTA